MVSRWMKMNNMNKASMKLTCQNRPFMDSHADKNNFMTVFTGKWTLHAKRQGVSGMEEIIATLFALCHRHL